LDALGKTLYWNDKPYPIVGVVADFHTHSLHQSLTPLCIINRQDRQGAIAIKLQNHPGATIQTQEAVNNIEKQWKSLFPNSSFSYSFFDDTLASLYKRDRQAFTLVNVSMGIAIFISCLGLFGLTHLVTQSRSKEMSIRKVLGAGIQNLVTLIGKDFLIQVMLAIAIASPIAWYLMNQWLGNFAYHTDIKLWIFLTAGTSIVLITFCTVGLLTIKAAFANPVKNLRRE
jgi:ABC-type antimicrobial peptide transport system permease subunit